MFSCTKSTMNYFESIKQKGINDNSDFLANYGNDLMQTFQETRDDVSDMWNEEPLSWAEFNGDFT